MAEEWYYLRGDQQVGPVSWDELAGAARQGEVTEQTYVWHDGMAQWQPAREVHGLPVGGATAVPSPMQAGGPPPRPDQAPLPPGYMPAGYQGGAILHPQAAERAPGAVAALVCGLVGLFCVGVILGPIAVVMGVSALRKTRDQPGRYSGRGMAIAGIVLGVVAFVGQIVVLIVRYA